MPVSNPHHSVSPTMTDCQGAAAVTIRFDAVPALISRPADIVLIMDRSGSMGGAPMTEAKLAAKALVQTVARASGSTDGRTLKNGTRLCLVSFSDIATRTMDLVTDVPLLNEAIDAMKAGGDTNHQVAFSSAANVLQASAAQRRIAIMFTDGNTTAGSDPQRLVDSMKQRGMEIYCIGLLTDVEPLRRWATAPASTHVASTNDLSRLQQVFAEIAAEVVLAGALDLELLEDVNPDFRITKVHAPSHGTAVLLDSQTIRWTADAAGAAGRERPTLRYEVVHTAAVGGTKSVSRSLTYRDRAGSRLVFPDPTITVDCSAEIIRPDPPPAPVRLRVEGCQDALRVRLPDTKLPSPGLLVQVDAVIRQVHPGKALTASVILTEEDAGGKSHPQGMKMITVPALTGTKIRDVVLRGLEFAVSDVPDAPCKPRAFRARVVASYQGRSAAGLRADPMLL